MNLFFLLEWTGTLLVILAYVLNQFSFISSTSLEYMMMNFIGAIFLGIILWKKKVYGPIAIQLVWGGVALVSIIQYFTY